MRLPRLAQPSSALGVAAVVALLAVAACPRSGSAQALPDLIVTDILVTPEVIVAGQTQASLRVTWRNAGSGSVPGGQRLCVRVDINPSVGAWSNELCTFAGAAPGFSTHATFWPPVFPVQSDYFAGAIIDSRNEVAESNNSNNQLNTIIHATTPDTTPPPVPSPLSPANGATTTDTTPNLDWSAVTDPQGNGTRYDVQVAPSSSFSSPSRTADDLVGSSWDVAPALAPGTHYWRVRSEDYAGNASAWTSPRSFTIPAPATPPTLDVTEPAADVSVPRGQPLTIVWNGTDPDSAAVVSIGYDVDQVFDNDNHTWIAVGLSEDGATSWSTTSVPLGTYYVFGMVTDGAATAHDFAAGRVTVTAPVLPDLAATIEDVVPKTVAPGGKVVVTTVIRNQGQGSAGPSHLRAYLSTNGNAADLSGTPVAIWVGPERPADLQTSAVAAIPANSNLGPRHLAFEVPPGMADSGNLWLKVQVDSEGAVAETNDQNNVAVAPVTAKVKRPAYGTTVLTHGWTPPLGCALDWMVPMAEAIRRRAGKGQILFYRPDATDPLTGLWSSSSSAPGTCDSVTVGDNDATGETILVVDWMAESWLVNNGWSEAAADALFAALLQGSRSGRFALSPLHLIGHSRGTVVNSELVERLLDRGFAVDHVTNLDPHWWGLADLVSDDWDVNARHPEYPRPPEEQEPAPVVAWAGVRAIDSYYQTDFCISPFPCSPDLDFDLTGKPVPGGANLDLTAAIGLGVEHSDVHHWYHLTIDPDPAATTIDEADVLGAGWFTPSSGACTADRDTVFAREADGYAFSRIGGTDGRSASCEAALSNLTNPRFGDGDAFEETFTSGAWGDTAVATTSGWQWHGGTASAYAFAPYLALYDLGELRHNRQYVPLQALGLWFEMKAEPVPVCPVFPDDVVRATLGSVIDLGASPVPPTWTTYSSPPCNGDGGFYFVPVPASFRGRVTDGVRFDLEANGILDHPVNIRSLSWVIDDAPGVITKPETAVGPTSATLNGWADPMGISGTAWFEWGDTTAYGATTSPPAPVGPGPRDVAASLVGLTCNHVYHYRAVAETARGRRHGADEILMTAACPTSAPPTAPSWLRVTAVSPSQIHLQWDDNSSTETGFGIERKQGCCSPWTPLPAAPANATTAESVGLACNTTYAYRVWAFNGAGPSATTNEAGTTTLACAPAAPPTAPSALQAVLSAPSQVSLSWQDNSSDETGFAVERKQGSAGSWAQIGTTSAGAPTFQDTSVTCGATWSYRVRATNASGSSAASNEATVTTSPCSAPPAAPSWLRVTAVSATQLHLQWDDNSNNESGFRIERKTGCCGPWTPLPEAPANATTYESTGLACSTSYAYRVWAYNAAGESGKTNEAARLTMGCP
jgi:hypothetical protein